MRTAYRILSTAVAVGAIFPFGTLPAHADSAPVAVEASSWFWSAQTTGQTVEGYPVPSVPLGPSGVTEEQLAVAYKGENETRPNGDTWAKSDKETFLMWDIYFVPEGSYVDSFTFSLKLDETAKQLYVPQEVAPPAQPAHGGMPPLIACFPTIGFGQGAGEAWAAKPDLDCTDPIVADYDEATKTFTFDATVQAQDWVDGKDNYGLGIRPATDQQDPFQLVFLGAKDVKATIEYTPAEDEEPETPIVQPDVVLPPVPPTDTSVFVPDTQPVPQPQPQEQPAPVVQVQEPVKVQPIAASPLKASRGLTSTFWFAMLGGVLVLGTASLILGDPLEATTSSRNRIRSNGRHRLTTPAGAAVRVTPSARPRIV